MNTVSNTVMSIVSNVRGVVRMLAAATALVLALGGCGSGDASPQSTSLVPSDTQRAEVDTTLSTVVVPSSSATESSDSIAPTTADTSPSSTSPAITATTAPVTTVTTIPVVETTTTTETTMPPLVDGFMPLTLVAPAAGATETTPAFSWQAVAGAAAYRLVVLGPNGPIWAWEGELTTIRLGGFVGERPAGFGGPVIVAGSAWSVAALDATGLPLAVSELRAIGVS